MLNKHDKYTSVLIQIKILNLLNFKYIMYVEFIK